MGFKASQYWVEAVKQMEKFAALWNTKLNSGGFKAASLILDEQSN